MNLRNIDLNLLVIFDALMTEKTITRAARVMGVTPSAVSHALQRLRKTFDDPLFERGPGTMAPTRRAQELLPFVRNALLSLHQGMALYREFVPATSRRSFRIRQSDFLSDCLLPRLCARVRAEAWWSTSCRPTTRTPLDRKAAKTAEDAIRGILMERIEPLR